MASAERWGTVRLNFDYIYHGILRSNEPITVQNRAEISFNVCPLENCSLGATPHTINWSVWFRDYGN